MNIYDLSREFWDFSFENPEKIKPNHIAMYFFAIEHCNRLGWKEKFGFPTSMVMDAISIKSYNTFIKTLNELVGYGFIRMVEKSKNQYSSNIIALSKNNKAEYKALDKAMIKHNTKQVQSTVQSTVQSIDSIDKPIYNTTNTPINKYTLEAKASEKIYKKDFDEVETESSNPVETEIEEEKKVAAKKRFSFRSAMLKSGFNEILTDEFLQIRKSKKAVNTEIAFNNFHSQVKKTNQDKNQVLKIVCNKQWKGFEANWLKNIDQKNEVSPQKRTNSSATSGSQFVANRRNKHSADSGYGPNNTEDITTIYTE